ncbi:MAG TPA: alpha/beta hydrolase, partial [Quisquiliibacterium sp.]|nr:alpha/beta hydrolase [Quisquiliibacterium sp.]
MNPIESGPASGGRGSPEPPLPAIDTGAAMPPPGRLLVVPGLRDSGAAHWQTWLQLRFPGAVRVYQRHWSKPDLDAWAARIGETLDAAGPGPWVAAAHGFGCLALMHHLQQRASPVRFALLVAPADPARFKVSARLPMGAPLLPSTLFASENDPGMPIGEAREWARRWGSWLVNLGPAGHVDAAAGYGPFPEADALVGRVIREMDDSPRQAPTARHPDAAMARAAPPSPPLPRRLAG